MPRQKGITQLDILRRKQAEIAEQLEVAEAKEREKEKQNEARRREIWGAIIADHIRAEPESVLAKASIELLSIKVTRPADRALFADLLAAYLAPKRGKTRKSKAERAVGYHPSGPPWEG
jgi:hypothetical protein